MTRQRKWQIRHIRQGLCILCEEVLDENSRIYCERHLLIVRERMRELYRRKNKTRGRTHLHIAQFKEKVKKLRAEGNKLEYIATLIGISVPSVRKLIGKVKRQA